MDRRARHKLVDRCGYDFGRGVVWHVSDVFEQKKFCRWQYSRQRTCVDLR